MTVRPVVLRIVFSAVIVLGIVLGTLLALEIGLRVVFARSTDFSMEMWKYGVQLKRQVEDPDIAFVHGPSAHAVLMGVEIRTNAAGMRGDEVAVEKPKGLYRILLLGDSTTLGWGVRVEDTVAKLLENDLNERAASELPRRFEVLNAGVGNYNTVQEVASYRRQGRLFRPDLVVLVYFINDAEVVGPEKNGFFNESSYAAAFLAFRLDAMLRSVGARPAWKEYYRSLYADTRPGWPAAKGALHTLVGITRDDGTALLVAILPELREINGEYPFAAQHEQIKAAVKAEGVPVLDLLDVLKGHGPEPTLFVTPADPHPNRKANVLVAAQLRDWIVREVHASRDGQRPMDSRGTNTSRSRSGPPG